MKRTDKIVVLGNYHKSNHEASRIVYGGGTNSNYRQVLEVNHNLMCNALTTLLKDNYVLEIRDKKTR